ncbi:MAG TPA: DUF2231 domain-containing protein [Lentimicrobium sp.]|nr:DUF2231 domain-containing protein [Lentimicrobium sp.]
MDLTLTTSHIHPLLVHFPIALIIVGCVAEFMALFNKEKKFYAEGALYLLVIGTLAAIPAVLTGIYMTEDPSGTAGNIRDLHETWAFISLTGGVVTMLIATYTRMQDLHSSKWEWITGILYLFTTVAIGVTGYLGGVLTHNYL